MGFTRNLEARVKEHNLGKTKSTEYYRPWELLYFEKLSTRSAARAREKQLKSGYGKKFLKKLKDQEVKRARSSVG